MSESAPTPDVKPGIKTTEFWLSAIATVVGILAGLELGGAIGAVVTVASAALVALGYTAARGRTKAAAAGQAVVSALSAAAPAPRSLPEPSGNGRQPSPPAARPAS